MAISETRNQAQSQNATSTRPFPNCRLLEVLPEIELAQNRAVCPRCDYPLRNRQGAIEESARIHTLMEWMLT